MKINTLSVPGICIRGALIRPPGCVSKKNENCFARRSNPPNFSCAKIIRIERSNRCGKNSKRSISKFASKHLRQMMHWQNVSLLIYHYHVSTETSNLPRVTTKALLFTSVKFVGEKSFRGNWERERDRRLFPACLRQYTVSRPADRSSWRGLSRGKSGGMPMTMIDINDERGRREEVGGGAIENATPRAVVEPVRLACMRALIIGAPALLIYFVGRSTDKSMIEPNDWPVNAYLPVKHNPALRNVGPA